MVVSKSEKGDVSMKIKVARRFTTRLQAEKERRSPQKRVVEGGERDQAF